MLHHIKKDLLAVKPMAVLVHAVNCQGVMGSGIAKEFKRKFPEAFKEYSHDCKTLPMIGGGMVYNTRENGLYMGCLFTSDNFGDKVSSPSEILSMTKLALDSLLDEVEAELPGVPVYSNKFNSGLFNVPWHKTEALLKQALKGRKVEWTVCASPYEVKP